MKESHTVSAAIKYSTRMAEPILIQNLQYRKERDVIIDFAQFLYSAYEDLNVSRWLLNLSRRLMLIHIDNI